MLQHAKGRKTPLLLYSIIFFTSGVFINLVQFLLYVTVRPWNRKLFRKVNYYLSSFIYSQLVFLGDWWCNIDLVFHADEDMFKKYCGKEHAYCIMNHTYEIDWLMMMLVVDRMGILGNTKSYLKKSLQYAPIMGWAWRMSDFILLDRSFEKDKFVIQQKLKELTTYEDPFFLTVFPEGTRFTQAKLEASQKFAREKNLKQLNHHLQPRTRGFTASLPALRSKVPAIYDVLIAFEEAAVKPTVSNVLKGKKIVVHVYLNRIPMKEVPETEKEQDEFLREVFVKKDKMKESFVQTGDFFKTSGVPQVGSFVVKRRLFTLVNEIYWMLVTLCPIGYLILKLLLSGQMLYMGIGAGIIIFFAGLFSLAVRMSTASKGSSYGTSQKTK